MRFDGTRPDDPNDIVPHEDRRELRGYGVFAAWLNHVDAKAINSLDTLVTENGRSFVRHHIIDFGSALGSGGVGPADYWEGAEYLDPAARGREADAWRSASTSRSGARRRSTKRRRSAGCRCTTPDFNPDQWKPRVPNQAFLHARADDKFWAARKLVAHHDRHAARRGRAPASSATRRRKSFSSGRLPSGATPSAAPI